MVSQNEKTTQANGQSEMCSIRIMFPLASDEQALNVKSKIKEALTDIQGLQLDIHFMTVPNMRARSGNVV